jgi:amino acid adenylation domain-containing protein
MYDQSLVPDRFAAGAAARPDAAAVVGIEGSLSYRDLDRRANAVARRLRALGVAPDAVVAVAAPRSAAHVVGALGVMKAGGGYLPLDPSYPRDRLAFVLADAQPVAVLAAPGVAGALPDAGVRTLVIDDAQAEAPPPPGVTASNLAYVIYTSGSTGRPKGVEVTHGGLANLVRWHLRAFEVGPEDRAMQYASPGFDATVWELWPALVGGASIRLPPEDVRMSPEAMRDWLVAEAITIGFVPTPMAERLVTLPWPATTRLRVLLTGADTLHRYPPASLPFALVNNYGPTEGTVVATSGVVPPGPRAGRPPIGRPIDGVTVAVLDERMRRVGDGELGELYIGGAGVARGYRRQPRLTQERFVPDPFSPEPGARLYRTGDLACRLPDGQIAFAGRADGQIKIRGFRVEPEEIVAALDVQPGVAASAVAAHDDDRGDRRLVAYVVRAPGAEPRPAALRAALRAVLPDYMVPSLFVAVPALPISPNGKVDRDALPAPDDADVLHDDTAAGPLSTLERRLATILAGLLDVERVGRDDNFFLLGGHSLLGTQVIARVREAFGVDLTLRALFDHPTVAALAGEIERAIETQLEAA